MYTRRIFPVGGVIKWTRRHIFLFLILATIPVLLFDLFGFKWLHVPWLPLGVLGTAVAFVVSFKNNASYDRLWEARKIWGGIVNASRTWTIMVKDFINNDHSKEKLSKDELFKIHRELVHRHVAWLTALRYQLRADKPWEQHLKSGKSNREFRENYFLVCEDTIPIEDAIKGYMLEDEFKEVFAKGNRASQLLGVQSRRLKELMQQGFIEDFRHMELANMLKEFYTLQGKSERIKNFPYPRQFATLNYLFVWIFIILLPFGIMEGFESIGEHIIEDLANHESHSSTLHKIQEFIAQHFVWFSIPFSTMLAWVFHTMEAIGENTENPFEGGPNDVPITDMSRGIEIDIRQLIDDTDIPEPYKWKNDIVM
ncbi:bestrophin family protein [Ichthyenterobacterium magnum]|uniref:Putative membrane protein n=1 Tax=Ichthyenterobacterium magnum TaxID=1230530 RepID=A0A420DFQ3_9FLAO|nr:bestrophin family ion channel [Ichthyenterobacterium magnum]RKE91983.1 putative membrane protein [Ichthyenterobacterium magnum]